MSAKRTKVEEALGGGGGGGGDARNDCVLPSVNRLVPFSFSEREILPIYGRLPEIHEEIAIAVRNCRRKKDLRESLRVVAYRHMNPSKYKSNMCFWYMEAYSILLLYEHPESDERKVSLEQFINEFPEFACEAPPTQTKLHE
jgi:hypothetical protein